MCLNMTRVIKQYDLNIVDDDVNHTSLKLLKIFLESRTSHSRLGKSQSDLPDSPWLDPKLPEQDKSPFLPLPLKPPCVPVVEHNRLLWVEMPASGGCPVASRTYPPARLPGNAGCGFWPLPLTDVSESCYCRFQTVKLNARVLRPHFPNLYKGYYKTYPTRNLRWGFSEWINFSLQNHFFFHEKHYSSTVTLTVRWDGPRRLLVLIL